MLDARDDSALGWIDTLDLDESLRCQRGRGGFHGVGFAWVFLLRDVLAEARSGLQAARVPGR